MHGLSVVLPGDALDFLRLLVNPIEDWSRQPYRRRGARRRGWIIVTPLPPQLQPADHRAVRLHPTGVTTTVSELKVAASADLLKDARRRLMRRELTIFIPPPADHRTVRLHPTGVSIASADLLKDARRRTQQWVW